jgi:hypothetical protein
MKMTNKLFITGLATAALIPVFQAHAQAIAASPKAQMQLAEGRRKAEFATASSSESIAASTTRVPSDGVAASPKVRMQLEERRRSAEFATAFPSESILASTTQAPNDGIVASPKLREQMRQRPAAPQVEIAPIMPAK